MSETRTNHGALIPPPPKPKRTCNRHDDCDAADAKAKAQGRYAASHCHDEGCDECFGKLDESASVPSGLTDERVAELRHSARLTLDEQEEVFAEIDRLRLAVTRSRGDAALGAAVREATRGLGGGAALVIRCWHTMSPDVEIWDDVTAAESDTYENDATRALVALLAPAASSSPNPEGNRP